ncbi:MAG: T9SS type A sorting domain-containing protein [Hymenobacter sp.]|nr:MAG: T9SS type A sorting domain-containing protein [Hymenobacter sp.]
MAGLHRVLESAEIDWNKASFSIPAINHYGWYPADPASAAVSAEQLPPGKSRDFVFQAIANVWLTHDPQAALAFAEKHGITSSYLNAPPDKELTDAAATHPEQALADIFTTPDASRKDNLTKLAFAWNRQDPEAAAKWLVSAAGSPDERLPVGATSALVGDSVGSWIRSDANGALRWQRSATGQVLALLPDGRGGAYLAGGYDQSGLFGGIPVVSPAYSSTKPYVAYYDSTGVPRWVAGATITANSSTCYITGLGLLPTGALLAGGTFSRQLKLSSFTLTETGGSTNTDPFLARMRPECTVPVLATAAGTATVCAGDTLRLRAQGAPAGATFQWSGPNGFASSLPTPVLPLATTALAGTYTLVLSAPASCITTTTLAVSVVAKPTQPTVQTTRNGATTTFTSSAATGNQWYRNGTLLGGATAQTYVVNTNTQPGSYSVVVTNAGGCASPASTASVVTATAQATAAAGLDLYPNPTPDGRVWLQRPRSAFATTLDVRNMLGETVRSCSLPASDGTAQEVDLHQLPAGVYVLLLAGADGPLARRLTIE